MPNKRRERIFISNVEPDVTEEEVKSALGVVLQLGDDENACLLKIKEKLLDPTLDTTARNAIEELLKEQKCNFEIDKKIKTRTNKINWLIDVDELSRKKITES